jgi:acetyl/propionyl-CoA carboxylase alpha subunit
MQNKPKKIHSILIANRSEVAVRIQSSCKALGIKTVAIYTKEDQSLSFASSASEAYPLSLSGTEGYMNQKEILEIAQKANVNAIHPGYGFLSESAVFAQKVINAGFIWIGPSPEVIARLGSKSNASRIMSEAKVLTLPHQAFTKNESSRAKKVAEQIGYPIILKAALGGGGRGMETVTSSTDFDTTWNKVISIGERLFHSSEILLEKYIPCARHIEVQIAGDGKKFIHLFERECSIQRRRQKIIEEAPSQFISDSTRKKIFTSALKAAETVSCDNIATIEFLVTPNESFFFMEMNPRLQVEHAVTEMLTGIDLVALQIQIAETKTLPLQQSEITAQGHAIECRIYAENPKNNFTPSTGKLEILNLPHGPFSRIEHDLHDAMEVSSLYDPMVCKIITHGFSRTSATQQMLQSLSQLVIAGIETNINFLRSILTSNVFLNGTMHSQYLNKPENVLLFCENLESLSTENLELTHIFIELFEKINKKSAPLTSQNKWKAKQWR